MQSPEHDYSKCSLLHYVPQLLDCDNQELTQYNVERKEDEKRTQNTVGGGGLVKQTFQ